uniref:EF-hand domain-containing protein n=1 Tax=Haptolina ericina TaxID=156174 RepID=A0A7S3AIB8_9EUKA|eukprot:CAMPEP_0181193256 /NCGR_PEP_ID=MMETSP1096-20121128/13723_1 /TAXON_ID=156174 ORGANISM="Chrysochromulina ericina, Strain CCMP281" /NCGR_SAMPLE_ID=MMETSP1096 /ASSEMBLY_ACC=CAM_ASM_000453 /LENGTH=342 /DNA_ID=CAMNT_0023282713 /DNA_START=36 /DNA_END=1064 /DNA_ORIENTATION=+
MGTVTRTIADFASEDVKRAFAAFDVDGSGKLSAKEVLAILTRTSGGAALKLEDAEKVIADFDKNGDGQLDLGEMVSAFSTLMKGQKTAGAAANFKMYEAIVADKKAEIAELFKKIDVSNDGAIDLGELAEIIAYFEGKEFHADKFFTDFDVQGAGAGLIGSHGESGDIDVDEFGWYIGSRAGHAPSVPKVIEQLSDACDFIQMKKDKKGGKILPDSAKENNDLYGKILVGFKKEVERLFFRLDVSGDGTLSMDEVKALVTFLEETAFDEKQFLEWWDVKGGVKGGGDKSIESMEFGWYVAYWAETSENMGSTIGKFNDAISYLHNRDGVKERAYGGGNGAKM